MSKFVELQAAVEISPATGNNPGLMWSMAEGVTFIVDNDPEFSAPASRQRAGARIVQAFERAQKSGAESHVELKDEDWASLNRAVESAQTPWGQFHQTNAAGVVIGAAKVAPRKFLDWTDAIAQALSDQAHEKHKKG